MFSQKNKNQLASSEVIEGVVIRGGFSSFGVELARDEYILLLKTSTGNRKIEFSLNSRRLKTKLVLTAAGDHVKLVATREPNQELVLEEFFNTNLTGIE